MIAEVIFFFFYRGFFSYSNPKDFYQGTFGINILYI